MTAVLPRGGNSGRAGPSARAGFGAGCWWAPDPGLGRTVYASTLQVDNNFDIG